MTENDLWFSFLLHKSIAKLPQDKNLQIWQFYILKSKTDLNIFFDWIIFCGRVGPGSRMLHVKDEQLLPLVPFSFAFCASCAFCMHLYNATDMCWDSLVTIMMIIMSLGNTNVPKLTVLKIHLWCQYISATNSISRTIYALYFTVKCDNKKSKTGFLIMWAQLDDILHLVNMNGCPGSYNSSTQHNMTHL